MVCVIRKLKAVVLAFVTHFVPQKFPSVEIWSGFTLALSPWYLLSIQLHGHYDNKGLGFSPTRWN